MPTLLDLITECLVGFGELGQGETPSPEDSSFCMTKANELLDSWQTERMNVYSVAETQLALSAKQSFTIGVGAADFNQARPVKIEACVILVPVNGVNVRMGECDLVGEARWREISDLSATSNVPEFMYPDYAWPVMTLNFWPAPKAAVTTIAQLSQWVPLQQFASLTDTFEMPYGYQKAFVDGLTVVIKKSYGRTLDPDDVAMEQSSKQRIQQYNAQLPNLGLFGGIPAPQAPSAPQ